MVSRKVLSCIAPGATPEKRKAPDGRIEGQIHVPCREAAPPDPSPVKAKKPKSKEGRQPKKRSASSSSCGSDSSSSVSDDPEDDLEDCLDDPEGFSTNLSLMRLARSA
jgi:hypothetical protein